MISLKSKAKSAALGSGIFIGTAAMGSQLATLIGANVPLAAEIPIFIVGSAVGTRQLIKELKEENKKGKKKLKKVV